MPDKNPAYFPVGCTLKTFTAHDLSERISWSPDGTRIAGGSNDGTIKILDVESGAVLRSFGTSEPRSLLRRFFATTQLNLTRVETHSVAWSPDGSTIAACLDQKLRAWQVETGEQLWECNLRTTAQLAYSPFGDLIAAACINNSLYLIAAKTGVIVKPLTEPSDAIATVAWLHSSRLLAAGSLDKNILVWDHWNETLKWKLEGHTGGVWSVACSPSQSYLASASSDRTVRLWDLENGVNIAILEGHVKAVKEVSFSSDGRFLASKSADSVRLWRTDTAELLTVLPEHNPSSDFFGLGFHPHTLRLASLGLNENKICIWDLDAKTLLKDVGVSKSTHYSNAKVVLVGDSSVGKTGLALVLTGQPWKKTGSTHGRRVWVLDSQEVETRKGYIQTRETLLWDLAGQPDYRPIHQLHLTEVAIALVVFDSRSQTDPFAGVRHWDRALRQAQRVQSETAPATCKYLVAARVDVGRIGASADRIESLCQELNFDRYFATSAKEGWGIEELLETIRTSINWDALPTVSSTELFQNIKTFLVIE